MAKNKKIMVFHKRVDKRLSDIQKFSFCYIRSPWNSWWTDTDTEWKQTTQPQNVTSDTVDSVTLIVKAHKQISAECKERWKSVLDEDIRTLCEFEMVLATTPLADLRKLIASQVLSVILGTQILVLAPSILLFIL